MVPPAAVNATVSVALTVALAVIPVPVPPPTELITTVGVSLNRLVHALASIVMLCTPLPLKVTAVGVSVQVRPVVLPRSPVRTTE